MRYALSVMCEDKVGLVARLAQAVSDLGGNIEELHQSVRLGYFVIGMMATFPKGVAAEAIRERLEPLGSADEFALSILPRRDDEPPPPVIGAAFVLTVFGADAPGVLARVTALLANRRVNFEDILSQCSDDRFTITARLTIPEDVDAHTLRLDLAEVLAEHAATVSLMHEDIFAATNRIDMRQRRLRKP